MIFTNFKLCSFLVGIAISFILTIIIRFIHEKVVFEYQKVNIWKKIAIDIKKIFLPLVSIDYLMAAIEKSKCKEDKNKQFTTESDKKNLSRYIKSANTLNLIVSCILVIFVIVVFVINNEILINMILGVISHRILSRTMEINISFVKDICDSHKSSDLNKNQRILLAIKSLIEEAVLFAGLYCFMFEMPTDWLQAIIGGLYSFTLGVFSPAKIADKAVFCLVSIWQKVCSGILVTLCIAAYLGAKDKEDNNLKKANIEQTNDKTIDNNSAE